MSDVIQMPANSEHRGRVRELGCVVCWLERGVWVYAEAHHPTTLNSGGSKCPDEYCLGLCREHHQDGGHGTAVHAGVETFEALHGRQVVLAALVIRSLEAGVRRFGEHPDTREGGGHCEI